MVLYSTSQVVRDFFHQFGDEILVMFMDSWPQTSKTPPEKVFGVCSWGQMIFSVGIRMSRVEFKIKE